MTANRTSALGSFVRGGQLTIHYIRMSLQIIKHYIKFCLFSFILLSITLFFLASDHYSRYVTARYVMAKVGVEALSNGEAVVSFRTDPDSERVIRTSLSNIVKHPAVRAYADEVYRGLLYSLAWSVVIVFLFIPLALKLTQKIGQSQTKNRHIRGSTIQEPRELVKALKGSEVLGEMKIASIPIPKRFETSHLLISGGPGTGKSVIYKALLNTVRKQGKRAIVYDIAGTYVRHFYRPDKDYILNPLDQRCAGWDVWQDCAKPWHYQALANSLIPDRAQGNDPFWAMAARIVFSSLAEKISTMEERSTELLIRQLLNVPLDSMIRFLEGTDATAVLNEEAEKMALSIRSMMATYTQPLKYMPEPETPFSIRQWVSEEDSDSWIFITSTEEQKETLKPLITTWIDIASSSILSLSEDQERRIWLMLDELPTLNRVPSLMNTLTNSRKFGCCGVIGFQSYPQLCDIYGREGANGLAEACSTWVVHRANGRDTAEWAAKALGDEENVETLEGLSYGVNDFRDGVNLNKQRQTRPLVIPSELLNLPDLQGYIRVGRNYPVARFTNRYCAYKSGQVSFIEREIVGKNYQSAITVAVDSPILERIRKTDRITIGQSRLVLQISLSFPEYDASAVAFEMSKIGIPIDVEAIKAIWIDNNLDTVEKRSLSGQGGTDGYEGSKLEDGVIEDRPLQPHKMKDERPKKDDSERVNLILQIFEDNPGLSYKDISIKASEAGISVSASTVYRILQKQGKTGRKKSEKGTAQTEMTIS